VDPKGLFRFFPFVVQPGPSEPKTIEINPMVGFGKPVIAGTAISTAIIASRFNARESVTDLASEYGCTPQQKLHPDEIVFYLDARFESHLSYFPRGSPDENWLPLVGQNG
jgi:uncharacterized protein (DUF433 family)